MQDARALEAWYYKSVHGKDTGQHTNQDVAAPAKPPHSLARDAGTARCRNQGVAAPATPQQPPQYKSAMHAEMSAHFDALQKMLRDAMDVATKAVPMESTRSNIQAWKLTQTMRALRTAQDNQNRLRRPTREEQQVQNREWRQAALTAYRDWFDECVEELGDALDRHQERRVTEVLYALGRHGRTKKKSSARNQPKTAYLRHHLGRTGGTLGDPKQLSKAEAERAVSNTPGCFGYTFQGTDKDFQGKTTVYLVGDRSVMT